MRTPTTICYPHTVDGFYNAVYFLIANSSLTDEEVSTYLSYPQGRRENFVSIIQRANSLRIQAVNKACVFNNLK